MRESMSALISKRSVTDWLHTSVGAGYCVALMEILERRGLPEISLTQRKLKAIMDANNGAPDEELDRLVRYDGVNFAAGWAAKLENSDPYWTSPDMTSLVDQAAQDIPEDFEILPEDLIEENGLAYLGRPIDIAGTLVNAASWQSIGSKIILTGYAHRHGKGDIVGEQVGRICGKTLPLLMPVEFQVIPFRTPLDQAALVRFMAAWWKLIEQPISTREQSKPRNSEMKHEKRLRQGELVTEVRLRSPKAVRHLDDREPSWEYSHRFLVKGHWRNQPYGDGHIERIYIAPYIKGPADKPLVIRTHVYRWDR